MLEWILPFLPTFLLCVPACSIQSMDVIVLADMDTASKITTKSLKENKKLCQRQSGGDAPADGNADEENREQETDNKEHEEEEAGGKEEEEEGDMRKRMEWTTRKQAPVGERVAEDDDDDVDTKKQKTDEDD
uniref:Prothymosin alpha n=1 Tax=Peromyscus maniculatus bairdii TaxID=230844 RepID=A0A8C8W593_PERMB